MRISWLAALAATVALGGTAQATTVLVDFTANPTKPVTNLSSGNLQNSTSIDFGSTQWTVSQVIAGDQTGLVSCNNVTVENGTTGSVLNISGNSGSVVWDKEWTSGGKMYTEMLTSYSIERSTSDQIGITLTGTLDINNAFAGNVTMIINLNQAGGPGTGIGGGLSNFASNLGSPAPGLVPGVGYAGLAALALAGLYTRAPRA